jgi:hypothetical protein
MRASDKEMAPAVVEHPEARTIGGVPMIKVSVAYVLCRIEDDSSLTLISEHEDIVDGVAAGKHRVEVEDFDFSYGLYADGVRVASFAEGRMGYREHPRGWGSAGNSGLLLAPGTFLACYK